MRRGVGEGLAFRRSIDRGGRIARGVAAEAAKIEPLRRSRNA